MRKILVVAAAAIVTIVVVGIGLALTQSTKTIPSSGVISTAARQGVDQGEDSEAYLAKLASIRLPYGSWCSTVLPSRTLDFAAESPSREM